MPGRFTFAPACICGMTTMKMIRRTRTTSTSGVTLMSGFARSGRRTVLLLLGRRLVLEVVEELALRLVQREQELVGARREEVEGEHRGDRDQEADRGDDQRLGDARRDRAEAARALLRDALERRDDADDRSQQPDERADRSDRREHAVA